MFGGLSFSLHQEKKMYYIQNSLISGPFTYIKIFNTQNEDLFSLSCDLQPHGWNDIYLNSPGSFPALL